MAALEAERLRDIGHVEVGLFEFREDDLALELLNALGKSSGARGDAARWAPRREDRASDFKTHLVVGCEQHDPFDGVAQFANIARPWMIFEGVHCLDGKLHRLPIILRADLCGKVLDQSGNVLPSLPQGRK